MIVSNRRPEMGVAATGVGSRRGHAAVGGLARVAWGGIVRHRRGGAAGSYESRAAAREATVGSFDAQTISLFFLQTVLVASILLQMCISSTPKIGHLFGWSVKD